MSRKKTHSKTPQKKRSRTTEKRPKEWTVMIFMAGDNDLSDRCVDDLKEMKRAGQSDDVAVIVQIDRRLPAVGQRPATRRVLSPRHNERKFKDVSSGHPAVLEEFVKWSVTTYPARRYLLIIWGHARGADAEPNVVNTPAAWVSRTRNRERPECNCGPSGGRVRGMGEGGDADKPFFIVCPDDDTRGTKTKDALTDIELKQILRAVRGSIGDRPLVFGMDACLLSMAEVCHEFGESVDYTLASEALVPGSSWPYEEVLGQLYKSPDIEAPELCRQIVRQYVDFYNQYDEVPVQLTACDIRRFKEKLVPAVTRLSGLLVKAFRGEGTFDIRNAVLGAHMRAQFFYDKNQFYDLFDFCYMLGDSCGNKKIQAACRDVMDAIGTERKPGGCVIASQRTTNAEAIQFSYGLSVYFPWADVVSSYKHLQFAGTGWMDFLTEYVEKSGKWERAVRDETERESSMNAGKPLADMLIQQPWKIELFRQSTDQSDFVAGLRENLLASGDDDFAVSLQNSFKTEGPIKIEAINKTEGPIKSGGPNKTEGPIKIFDGPFGSALSSNMACELLLALRPPPPQVKIKKKEEQAAPPSAAGAAGGDRATQAGVAKAP